MLLLCICDVLQFINYSNQKHQRRIFVTLKRFKKESRDEWKKKQIDNEELCCYLNWDKKIQNYSQLFIYNDAIWHHRILPVSLTSTLFLFKWSFNSYADGRLCYMASSCFSVKMFLEHFRDLWPKSKNSEKNVPVDNGLIMIFPC